MSPASSTACVSPVQLLYTLNVESRHVGSAADGSDASEHSPETKRAIDLVLDTLYRERGLDFRLYRRSTIERRLSQRLGATRALDFEDYLRLLAREPAELDRLVCHLTLKVTSFFRNAPVFELLRTIVLPDLLGYERISLWSAGCATGEEAYSLAILLADAFGFAALAKRSTIVATDIDANALEMARAGQYATATLAELPNSVVDRWFAPVPDAQRHQIRDELRRAVSFQWHSLIDGPAPSDGPFDLVLCRNVLIYFQRPLQERVVNLLNQSVRQGGYLVLGEAESLPLEIERQYLCLDRRGRIYRKK